jgi:hypothetical protein
LCAGTTALHAQRKLKHQEAQAEWSDETVSNQLSQTSMESESQNELSAAELWHIVDGCCKSEQERVLARLSFVSDMLPRAILELHPALFASTEEISNIRRNLLNRLARNPQLKQLWGEG